MKARSNRAENAPDHRVCCEGMEGWCSVESHRDKVGAYLSRSTTVFTQPVRPNLFQSTPTRTHGVCFGAAIEAQ
ncbi:DUF736 domain-containing protein [Mesorhizobium sp. M1182]|uniref:hypothetical protein n=1 Tax=Mesorhizobium sp. M1182 TaxID=2957067 RepID=UPI00333964F7